MAPSAHYSVVLDYTLLHVIKHVIVALIKSYFQKKRKRVN